MHQNVPLFRIYRMEGSKPSSHLRSAIVTSIREMERRRARTYVAVASIVLFSSGIGLIFSVDFLLRAFYQSEFYSYVSLIFSDPDILLNYWQYIVLSLAESLPVLAIIASLVAALTLLASIRVLARNIRAAFAPSPAV